MSKYIMYPVYKQTGLEWLPEIPTEWKYGGLTKFLESIVDYRGKTPEKVEEGVFLVTARNIKQGQINYDLSHEYIKLEDYEEVMRRGKPKIGDVLFTTEAPLGEVANIDREDIALAQRVIKFRSLPKVLDNYYLKYWILSHPFQSNLKTFATGSTAEGIKASKLSKLQVILPSLREQQKIVRFLDKKLCEIDNLIESKRKLIKILEQQRQSIITEAVTKGLNPNVKMKDSGVEWIGEIPEHWEEKKIKYLFYEANERNFNEDATLLSLFTSIGVKPRKEMEQKGNKAQTVINYKIVRKKDIVVNKLLAWMGAIGLSEYNGVTSPDYDVYRPLNTEKVEELYYHYYFRNHYFKGDCFKFGRGIMMMRWRTYPEQLKSILVPVPPKEEQIQIANYIEYKEKELAQTIKNIEKSIEKLKEYRQSLIYEAVTGKIDVRDMELN